MSSDDLICLMAAVYDMRDQTKHIESSLCALMETMNLNGSALRAVLRAQDTGKFRTNTLDQFYTKDEVAKKCVDAIIAHVDARQYTWIEPAVGTGAFLRCLPADCRSIGIDLDPRVVNTCAASRIVEADYLTYDVRETDGPIILFGNPPFGRQSATAKAFIAKGCKEAEIIAFVLPLSFTKPSMNCVFDSKFHLIYSMQLERSSFIINDGTSYDVPCVFQIWRKMPHDRIYRDMVEPIGFEYVSYGAPYDIAIRRVGVYAGRCTAQDKLPSKQTHYFVRIPSCERHTIERISKKIDAHTFPTNTVGPRSLSKSEVSVVLNAIIRDE